MSIFLTNKTLISKAPPPICYAWRHTKQLEKAIPISAPPVVGCPKWATSFLSTLLGRGPLVGASETLAPSEAEQVIHSVQES